MLKRTIPVAAACALLLAGSLAPVLAKKPTGKAATSKLTFKLDDHSVATGEDVTGTVTLTTAKGKKKSTPIANAPLTVQVDGVDVATLTTAADGTATLTLSGIADGEHVAKVVYAGDATYKKATRSQGFTVGAAEEETPDPDPSPSPSV